MKSRIWRLAGVGLLSLSISATLLADERNDSNPLRGSSNGGQHGGEGRPGNNEGHGQGGGQTRPQNTPNRGPENQSRPQPRPQNSPRPEYNGQNQGGQGGQWQSRPQRDPNAQPRPQQQPRPNNGLPIQPRPDTVYQTQQPLRGSNQDIPRRNDNNQHWQGGGSGSRPGDFNRPNNNRPNDDRWAGRPSGHGNGWGSGPQYRPGYIVDRFPDRNMRVPYRGQDYFFSGGYWYRPQGPRYVVVRPPYGIRVNYLPDYAREVWIGSSLLFLAAGAYYMYQPDVQQYVVVEPPTASLPSQPVSSGFDVQAYAVNGQTQAQIEQDRYDCYRWAVQQSNFDPSTATYAPDASVVQAYRQAEGSCLSSRGYQVSY